MNRTHLPAILALALGACAPGAAPPTATSDLHALATFAAPTFLENLTITSSGAIYVTNYTGKTIERIDASGAHVTLTQLDVHPVSILETGDGFWVAAHATPFTAGPSFLGSGVLLRLNEQGAVTSSTPVPNAGFLNGMVRLPDGGVLVADSANAQILRFDPTSGTFSTWFVDPTLAPQAAPFLPGANGLKLAGETLIISSSAQRALFRLPITPAGAPRGPLTRILGDLPGADDFVALSDGGFIVATHGDSVVRLDAVGAVTILTDDPRVRGNTAIGLVGEGADRRAIILGTGGFSAGGGDDAVVVSAPAPE